MSNLGQKIKEAFTGHHDQDKSEVKTPDVNAPGAYPSDEYSTKHHSDHSKLTKEPPSGPTRHEGAGNIETGAQHHTGHAHHDPEPETKQATSDAGNYPYWGNLPREGGEHVHRSEGPNTNALKQHHEVDKDSSLGTGASAAAVTTAGAGYIGSRELDDQEKDTTHEQSTARRDSKFDHEASNTNKAASFTGIAGTTYLTTKDKAEADRSEKKSDAPAHSNTIKTTQHTETFATTAKPAETATPTKTTSSGDNNSHKKEEEALAAGAGAVGLAVAGYYASQREDKSHDSTRDPASCDAQGSNTKASKHVGTSHHDPVTEAQKAASAAGNYPYLKNEDSGHEAAKNTGVAEAATPSKTTSSGDNDRHRKEQAVAEGAGASGPAAAGYLANNEQDDHNEGSYLANKKQDDHNEGKQASPKGAQFASRDKGGDTENQTHASLHHDAHSDNDKKNNDNLNSTGLAAAGIGGAGLAGAGYLASTRKEEHRDELPDSTRETSSGLAAPGSLAQCDTTTRQVNPTTSGGIHNTVVGAGSSGYSHPVGSSSTMSTSHQPQSSSQTSQGAAQVAAKQAWSTQQPTSSTTVGDSSKESKITDLKHAATGAAFGAGAAGLAADYGQGKDHENNPRSDKSEEIAERSLGSDGKPHAPSETDGPGGGNQNNTTSGLTSGVYGLAERHGSSGTGSKVLHKCDRCGHDNDISRYFDKDAVFRSQQ